MGGLEQRVRLTGVAGLVVLVCGLSTDHGASPAAASTAPPCAASSLSLSLGPSISPETGEHGVILRLTNHARRCTLYGYPGVTMFWRGRALPFSVLRGGGYGTDGKSRRVVLEHGRRASFIVAKYRCDIGVLHVATEVRVYPPNTTRQLRTALHGDGVSDISYCRAYRGPSRTDPGNTLHVSPVSRRAYPYTSR
jgi:hypothetical protein